ncbi:MAG: GTP-binding protein [Pseudomonadota bacterium]
MALARESLRELLGDPRLPEGVRDGLAEDYASVKTMLDKLENGHLHIAAFGRVSTGKSSLLNALMGEARFSVSPLHGETTRADMGQWQEVEAEGVFFIDTPGIDEADGDAREALARDVVGRSDLVLFVVDSDLTSSERSALESIASLSRPVLLVLNKTDRYTESERDALLASLATHSEGLIDPRNIVTAAADPAPEVIIRVNEAGDEVREERRRPADVTALRDRLWRVLEKEGKTLAALNASLFAGDLSDKVGQRILEARRQLAERVVRMYCLAKGVAVAVNPIPVADLVAAAVIDVGMVRHLSRLYGLPLSEREAGAIVKVVIGQAAALMGTVWAVHLASSALKVGTGGLSTLVTASAQGAVAWYSTYLVGKVADRYLADGKSWGDGGPKQVVQDILNSLDRDSILAEAREEIRARLSARS